MALAGFSVGEAEGLPGDEPQAQRRGARGLRERFTRGAAAKGVDPETADRVYDKLASFSGFGFPKSHAAAFALLGYQSAWLRHYYPPSTWPRCSTPSRWASIRPPRWCGMRSAAASPCCPWT